MKYNSHLIFCIQLVLLVESSQKGEVRVRTPKRYEKKKETKQMRLPCKNSTLEQLPGSCHSFNCKKGEVLVQTTPQTQSHGMVNQ